MKEELYRPWLTLVVPETKKKTTNGKLGLNPRFEKGYTKMRSIYAPIITF